jgi:hypothetical protein
MASLKIVENRVILDKSKAEKCFVELTTLSDDETTETHFHAKVLLGFYHLHIDYDFLKALNLLEMVAHKGLRWGKYYLGFFYLRDYTLPKEKFNVHTDYYSVGLKLMKEAADTGHPFANTDLYLHNFLCGHNDVANRWLERGISLGDPTAHFIRGLHWQHGLANSPINISMSAKHYEKAAAAGDCFAMFKLAEIYETGPNGFPIDMGKAMELYKKVIAGGHVPVSNLTLTRKIEKKFDGAMDKVLSDYPKEYSKLVDLRKSISNSSFIVSKNKLERFENLKNITTEFFTSYKPSTNPSGYPLVLSNIIVEYAQGEFKEASVKEKVTRMKDKAVEMKEKVKQKVKKRQKHFLKLLLSMGMLWPKEI